MRVVVRFVCLVLLVIAAIPFLPQARADSWTCSGTDYTSNQSPNAIQNGGFEDDLTSWYSLNVPSPTISTSIYHSGAKSAHVDANANTPTHAEQNLGSFPSMYVFSHWFYVATWGPGGHFATELIQNWQPSLGTANFVSQLYWLPPYAYWRSWVPSGGSGGVTQQFPLTLTTSAWHVLDVVVDASRGRQCLFVDGSLVGSAIVGPSQTFAPDVVLFGDISQVGDAGDAYFDDFEILSLNTAPPPPREFACDGQSYRTLGTADYLQNGGFEDDLTGWYSLSVPSPTISTSIFHSGAKSAHVDANANTPTHAEQNLGSSPPVYVFSHWFYVAAWGPGGHFAAELIQNWQPSLGIANLVSQFYWLPPYAYWRSWVPSGGAGGVTQQFDIRLDTGTWHLIDLVVDATSGKQCLYLDGGLLGRASVTPSLTFPPETVLFGDISQVGDAGDAYYDDFSIRELQPILPDLAVKSSDLSVTPDPPLAPGLPALIDATVHNLGGTAARGFTVTTFVDSNGNQIPESGEVLGTQYVSSLDPGASASFRIVWIPSSVGAYSVCSVADPENAVAEGNEENNVACTPVEVRDYYNGFCPQGQGYWKDHVDAWPVDVLVLGSRAYTKGELLDLLRMAPTGDASLILAHQFIAAQLNVLAGADASGVQGALRDANDLLQAGGSSLPLNVKPSSPEGARMVEVANLLEEFNRSGC